MAANFDVRKIYSSVERMDDCKFSIEIIILSLKERIPRIDNFRNKHTTGEIVTQTIDDRKISPQNKHRIFQRMDDCHSFYDRNKHSISKDRGLQ